MQPSPSRSLAVVSAFAAAAFAAERPRYGGVLRVEVQSAVSEPFLLEQLGQAVFENLTRLDARGRVRPALAVSWKPSRSARRWEFELRSGVKCHDGSALTPAAVAAALQYAQASATATGIIIQLDKANPNLPADLAGRNRAIVLRAPDGAAFGTGPFRIERFDPGKRVVLTAFEDHWEGRPFLDGVNLEMGRTPQQQLLSLELRKTDLAEVAATDARRAAQSGVRLWSSAPVDLVAVKFEKVEDARVREAVALSIDRAAIHAALLQKQGAVASGVLPQWMSGYAFLFPAARDTARAKELAPYASAPVSIGYDAADPLTRLIAERIALNAREAGVRLVPSPQPDRADVRVVRSAATRLMPPDGSDLSTPEALYAAERALIEEFRIVPLVHLPRIYASSPRLRSWNTPGLLRHDEWRLEDLWLAPERR